VPAARAGIPVYYVRGPGSSISPAARFPGGDPLPDGLLTGSGSLEELLPLLS
jgi:hypothetical protein